MTLTEIRALEVELRKASRAIFITNEAEVAGDISKLIFRAADAIALLLPVVEAAEKYTEHANAVAVCEGAIQDFLCELAEAKP